MNEFLIHCSFKQYSMALKFDLLIQRYAILILHHARDHGPALCDIAQGHGPALCGIAQDLHTNFIQKKVPCYVAWYGINTFSLISQRI
jgi:hypothetical protein